MSTASYNLLATIFFVFLGLAGKWLGPLLWPAVANHPVLTVLLAREWGNKTSREGEKKQGH